MERSGHGKLAFTLYKPRKGAVRDAMRSEFMDELPKFEFFKDRKAGKEPSQIPASVTDEVVSWMFAQPDEALRGAQTGLRVSAYQRLIQQGQVCEVWRVRLRTVRA